MNNVLKRFGVLLFALAASFNFLASVNSEENFNSFCERNSLVAILPEVIPTEGRLVFYRKNIKETEYKRTEPVESLIGKVEESFYEGEIASNNDRFFFSVKTIFLKNSTITRSFSVKVYRQNSAKPYFTTSIALESKMHDDCPGTYRVWNSIEIEAFIKYFFREGFVDRISNCRTLPIFEIEE